MPRHQQTLARSVTLHGFGLFGGVDVRLDLCPAPPHAGVVFERVDLSNRPQIPALIEHVAPQPRCTVLSWRGVQVAVVEHVLAALAALRVDNCLVRLNAPEPPGCDGSAQPFVDLIDKAGVVRQDAWRPVLTVQECLTVTDTDDVGVAATPPQRDEYLVGYILNYGPGPITPQAAQIAVTPDLFRREIANSRTFVLEQEVQALRAAGIGRRATTQHLLVCGAQGPIENQLRNSTECARHKLLDCIGDFSLIGCDLRGRFVAQRSGHRHNHELIRELRRRYLATIPSDQTISAKAA